LVISELNPVEEDPRTVKGVAMMSSLAVEQIEMHRVSNMALLEEHTIRVVLEEDTEGCIEERTEEHSSMEVAGNPGLAEGSPSN
jgi:hypothetical protein